MSAPQEPAELPEDPARKKLVHEIALVIDRNYQPFTSNSKRILILLTMAERIDDSAPQDLKVHRDDLLRAAVVFLHASVEELLRGLAVSYLPLAGEEALNRIPIAGSSDTLRAEKFLLGRLARHRGKSVDDLISESVREHVARRSFSDITEIAGLFEHLGFTLDDHLRKMFSGLGALIARRHQIVHRADILIGQRDPTPIDVPTVRGWLESVQKFFSYVSAMDIFRTFPALVAQNEKSKNEESDQTPNKAPEPTSGTVPSPAEPGAAPVPPVAHL